MYKGGLSSFSLVNMGMAFLICKGWTLPWLTVPVGVGAGYLGSMVPPPKERVEDVGELQLAFFDYFGLISDYTCQAISVTRVNFKACLCFTFACCVCL